MVFPAADGRRASTLRDVRTSPNIAMKRRATFSFNGALDRLDREHRVRRRQRDKGAQNKARSQFGLLGIGFTRVLRPPNACRPLTRWKLRWRCPFHLDSG